MFSITVCESSDWLLLLLTIGVPIAVMLIWLLIELMTRKGVEKMYRMRRFFHELHCFMHGHIFALCMTLLVVQILKASPYRAVSIFAYLKSF